jgi:Flp pilus assembly protein TadB
MHAFDSPFIVPLGAFLVAIVAIIANAAGKIQSERVRAEQRIALLARGIPPAEVERMLTPADQQAAQGSMAARTVNPVRTAGYIRLTALILIFSGLGLIAFFVSLALILQERQVYAGAATALIPIIVGFGFLIDYGSRLGEIARMRQDGRI